MFLRFFWVVVILYLVFNWWWWILWVNELCFSVLFSIWLYFIFRLGVDFGIIGFSIRLFFMVRKECKWNIWVLRLFFVFVMVVWVFRVVSFSCRSLFFEIWFIFCLVLVILYKWLVFIWFCWVVFSVFFVDSKLKK